MRHQTQNRSPLYLFTFLSMILVACGGETSQTITQEFAEHEPVNGLAQIQEKLFVLESVDGEFVGAADEVLMVFQDSGDVLIEDASSCRGLLPVVSQEATLSLGVVRSRGCHVDYLAGSNQVTLAEAFREGDIPFEYEGENILLEVDGSTYLFIPSN